MSLTIVSIELSEANRLVRSWHRHRPEVRGHKFSIGAWDTAQAKFVGAAIIGRPVARNVDWRNTVEVTRLVTDGTKNACSILYAAAARAAKEMGYAKIQTYILGDELGTSLIASGWICESLQAGGGDWSNRPGKIALPQNIKQRWAKIFRPAIYRDVTTSDGQLTLF